MKFLRLAACTAACIFSFSLLNPSAWSQAMATASKGAEISGFGAFMGGDPDFGGRSYKGMAAGVDYTFFPRSRFAPSVEARGTELLADDITEKAVMIGPRVQMDFRRRFHPYADFLYGGGEVLFHPYLYYSGLGYTGDRSRVYSYGGGINIDVARHVGVKFDVQGQNWNFGKSLLAGPDGEFTLTPLVISAGVTYTIPFRKHNRKEDFR
jgi:hypothetical protein